MKHPFMAIVFAFIMLAAAAIATADDSTSATNGYGQPVASKELVKVLADMQKLDSTGMLGLQAWAAYAKPEPPELTLSPLDQVESDIMVKLSPPDREAVLSWLNHGGRAKLHARRVSDADIGPCVDLIDLEKCNVAAGHIESASDLPSRAFRNLPFTVAAGANQDGGIAIERGFAIVKNDATLETHCVSFKNVGQKKVAAVTFLYKIHAQSGQVVVAGSNVRAGSFDPGSIVAGPATAADLVSLRNDSAGKLLLDNCWTKTTQLATAPLLRAAYITVGIAAVTYDDGSHWPGQ
ncbi:MAG TPA: hypothetical protein VGQ96_03140 [Candidatus Eremiobacteraceae bacterium]|nr:hypothetical protein [Candidatus Eremiobacteraceae bacterium]